MRDRSGPPVTLPRRPAATVVLRRLATSPTITRVLAFAWLGALFIGSQIPQQRAPLVTTDGFARGDLQALAVVGLDHLGDSGLVWVLAALTVVAVLARLLFAPPLAGWSWPAATGSPVLPTSVDAVDARVRGHLATLPLAARLGLQLRREQLGATIYLTAGRARAGRVLLAVAAVLMAATIGLLARADPPLRVDVPIRDGEGRWRLQAWQVEAGRLVPLAQDWSGSCALGPTGLACSLELDDGPVRLHLAPGQAVALGSRGVVWQATATDPAADSWVLRWRDPDGAAWQTAIAADHAADIRSSGQRLLAVASGGGPLIVASNGGDSPAVHLLALPRLAADGVADAAVTAAGQARLLITTRLPMGLPLAAALCFVLGVLLTWVVPAVRLQVEPLGDGLLVALVHANRSSWPEALAGSMAAVSPSPAAAASPPPADPAEAI